MLNPEFQRRSVWKAGARSYFIDTIIRGLPVPLVFLRERVDVDRQDIVREVVDGQQRLRTILGFVDEKLIPDFNPAKDRFTVMAEHNPDPAIAGKQFRELRDDIQGRILKYRFSIQILPADMEDRDILQIFARLNSTGLRLNAQELRNAEWFGKFKTLMFDLAYEQLERWLEWKVFTTDQVSRMQEVELVSDFAVNIMRGLTAKNQKILDDYYKRYDAQFREAGEVERRFRHVMDSIDDLYGFAMAKSAFSRVMHFYTLFVYSYDSMFGLGSELKRTPPKPLPKALRSRLDEASRRFLNRDLPSDVLQAVSGAATDLGKRKTRLKFLRSISDAKAR